MAEDVQSIVTQSIINALENGVVPWRRPWDAPLQIPRNVVTKKSYRGINFLILALETARKHYSSSYWMTYKQASAKGGQVRKGEKSTPVIFWKTIDKEEIQPDGSTKKKKIWFMRYYRVFNADQVDGIKLPAEPMKRVEGQKITETDLVSYAESVIAGMPNKPMVQFGGNVACFIPAMDQVCMPLKTKFFSVPGYYTTFFHELVHSTGHPTRLKRFPNTAEIPVFGSEDYSEEELIAELGGAFLSAECGIDVDIENTAAYVQGWLNKLSGDRKLIIKAASAAAKAVDYIMDRKAQKEEEEE